jgi:hypothetical protein
MQKTFNDSFPQPVYKNVNRDLQHLRDVLADPPCLSCPESMLPQCNEKDGGVEGCPKLTAWLLGGK